MRPRSKINAPSVPIPELTEPKTVIMYDADEGKPDVLYQLARLEDATIDKIARRVVEMLDQRREAVVDLIGDKKRKRKS
jgi:hypothetical protein